MTKKIIFNLFLKGMLVSLFFVLPLGLEAKNIDIGTKLDQIRIPGTLCLGGNCKTSWDQAGLWEKNGKHAYYSVVGGNVGIGTNNPQLALDIAKTEGFRTNGPVIFSGSLYTGSGNRLLTVDNTGNVFATSISSAVGLPSSATAGQTLRSNGTSWLANSNLYNDGTNVGIGTTGPSQKLEVFGSSPTLKITQDPRAAGDSSLWLTSAGAANFVDLNLSGGHIFKRSDKGAKYIYFGPDTTLANAKMAIDFNGGNVGIGTTSPIRKLGVKGEVEFTGLAHGLSPGESQDLALTTVVYVRDYVSGISTSTVGFWTKSGNNIYNANSANVGIGVSNPVNKLDVAGTLGLLNGNSLSSSEVVLGPYSSYGLRVQNDVGYVNIAPLNGGWAHMYTDRSNFIFNKSLYIIGGRLSSYSTADLTLSAGGSTNDITIKNTGGNVGIGVDSPSQKLDVFGGAQFSDKVYGSSPGDSQTLALTTVEYVNAVAGGTVSGVGLWSKSTTGDNIFNANSGNVGIGISNPSTARLQISNLANTEGLRIIASNHSPLVIRNTADNSDLMRLNQEGKLELNSSLKVGNTDDVCDASNTGAIKHNPVSGQSYICNGKMWLNQNNCGMVADEDGNTYGTVQIGGQCWMTENMRVGTMLASVSTKPNTGDQVIEKWCYDDNPANCEIYGGLYDWNEAMRGSEVSGAQGICPSGWHIPTDAEINELEKTAVAIINSSNSQYPCDLNSSGLQRCADNTGDDYGANGAGSALRQVGLGTGVGNGTDLVGFSGNLPGYRNANGSYYHLGSYLHLWSSTPAGSSTAWRRTFYRYYSTVHRITYYRGNGFSVPCLRD